MWDENWRKLMTARDVEVDEINMRSITSNKNDSVVKHDVFHQYWDSPIEENEEFDFILQENCESTDSKTGEYLNKKSTCLENTDPVAEIGNKIKENENLEIRRKINQNDHIDLKKVSNEYPNIFK